MKKILTLFLSFLILICGCSSTYHLSNFSEIKEELLEETAIIKLKTGKELEGEIIAINSDTLKNYNFNDPQEYTISLRNINEILVKNGYKGFLGGIGIGLGIYSIHSSVGSSSEPDYTLILAPFYTLVAGIVGGIIGPKDKYIISSSLSNKYFEIYLSDLSEKIASDTTQIKENLPIKSKRKEFVFVKVNSIIDETEKFIIVNYKEREIKLAKSEIKERKKKENSVEIKISKDLYLKTFK